MTQQDSKTLAREAELRRMAEKAGLDLDQLRDQNDPTWRYKKATRVKYPSVMSKQEETARLAEKWAGKDLTKVMANATPSEKVRMGADNVASTYAKIFGENLGPAEMRRLAKYGPSDLDDKAVLSQIKDIAWRGGEKLMVGALKGAEGLFDLVSRGEYATLAAVKGTADMAINFRKLLGSESPAEALDAMYRTVRSLPPLAAMREIFSGLPGVEGQKIGYDDLVQAAAPEWSKENPGWASWLAMGLSIAGDPLTWATFGTGGLIKAGLRAGGAKVSKKVVGKTLTKAGEQLYKARKLEGVAEGTIWREIATTMDETVPVAGKWVQRAKGNVVNAGPEHMVINVGVPFKRGQDYLLRVPGLSNLRSAAKRARESKIGEAAAIKLSKKGVKAAVERVDPELRRSIDQAFKNAARFERKMEEFARDKLIPLGPEGWHRIGKAAALARDKTDEWFRINDGKIGSDAVEFNKIRKEAMQEAGLSGDEKSILGQLYHRYNEMYKLEEELGLIEHVSKNYSPYIWNMIKDGKAFNALLSGDLGRWNKYLSKISTRVKAGTKTDAFGNQVYKGVRLSDAYRVFERSPQMRHTAQDAADMMRAQYLYAQPGKDLPKGLPWARDRVFKDLKEAAEMGLAPETDAMLLYLHRGLSSSRIRLDRTLKTLKDDFLTANAGKLSKHEQRMVNAEFQLYGDLITAEGPTFMDDFLKAYDGMLSTFKKGATVFRPGFIPRTFSDELTRGSLLAGLKAYKGYDPTSIRIAANVVEALSKGDRQTLSKLEFTDVFNGKVTGMDIWKEVRDHRVLQGQATGGVGRGVGLERLLAKYDKEVALGTDAGKGVKRVWKEALKYWNYPEKLTDFVRTMHYINGRKLGMVPEEAAKRALDISFDYANGLTKFEEKFMTRLIPFYKFNRFAIPSLAKAAVTRPGNIANFGRSQRLFFETLNRLYSGWDDKKDVRLNEAERRSLDGNYILEMPSMHAGWTEEDRARLFAFNNFSTVDTFQTGVYNRRGELDVARTVEKTVLAALTPFVKTPAESFWDYQTFSGRKISDSGKWATANDFYRWMDDKFPFELKKLIGFEIAKDYEGKDTVYINPTMLFAAMNAFPVLRDFQRLMDPGDNIGTKAMEIIGGISVFDRDLKAGAERMVHGFKSEQGRIKAEIRKDAVRNAEVSVYEDFQDLRTLYENLHPSVNTVELGLRREMIRGATDRVDVSKLYKTPTRPTRRGKGRPTRRDILKNSGTVFPGLLRLTEEEDND